MHYILQNINISTPKNSKCNKKSPSLELVWVAVFWKLFRTDKLKNYAPLNFKVSLLHLFILYSNLCFSSSSKPGISSKERKKDNKILSSTSYLGSTPLVAANQISCGWPKCNPFLGGQHSQLYQRVLWKAIKASEPPTLILVHAGPFLQQDYQV